MTIARALIFAVVTGALPAGVAASFAQEPSAASPVDALRRGGLVIVMRHASSPRDQPGETTANRDNPARERQLDQVGRDTATAMGRAMRALKIPIGLVLSSPTYRALETAKYIGIEGPRPVVELGDGGQSMAGVTDEQAAWLRAKAAERPARGSNTLIVTHSPNLSRAFPDWGAVADGESVVVRPTGKSFEVVARIPIERWAELK